MTRSVAVAVAVVVLVSTSPAMGARSTPTLKISGAVPKPLALTVEELATLPRQEVNARGRSGGPMQRFAGVAVSVLLKHAGMTLGDETMGSDHLATSIIAEGDDGYRVVLAMAEVDPAYTAANAIVADHQDGKPIGEGGGWFRLILPDDRARSRWVQHLVNLRVVNAPKPEP